MKTLITTMAVLFTMATAASAATREPLGDCMIDAFIQTVVASSGITYDEVVDYLLSPEGSAQKEELLAGTDLKVAYVVASKYAGESMNSVLADLETSDPIFNAFESVCVVKYFSETA